MAKASTQFKQGNQAAAHGFRWRRAIANALDQRSKRDQVVALELLAEKLIDMALAGDLGAIKEIGNRLDGMPPQSVDVNRGYGLGSGLTVILQSGIVNASDNSVPQLGHDRR